MPTAAEHPHSNAPPSEPENSTPPKNIIRTDLFSLESLPGKGKGLIASQSISPGTCLISESPLFTTTDLQSSNNVERDLAGIVKSLPKDSQRAFLTLHNNAPGGREPFTNIVRTNAYPLGPSSSAGGIFPWVARINHSCRANTQQAWNAKRQQETVYAVRAIDAGTEITIGYSIGGVSTDRQRALRDHFGFDCHCELCSLPGPELQASDARHATATELDARIGDPKRVRRMPDRALADCRALMELYAVEGIADSRVPRLWFDAFQICVLHGDAARGGVFAARGAEARRLCEGPESADAVEMEGLARRPEGHGSFEAGGKWKLGVEEVPRGLDERAFERWLWREA